MKYTQIPTTAFQNIQLNAGIMVDDFNPETGVVGNLLGATSGGVNFADTPSFKDFGEDIDNCPKNMLELKRIESREVKMSGTFVTITANSAKRVSGAADIDALNNTHIIPRDELLSTDFATIWWIGDYSDVNTGDSAGFVAIKLLNALSTGGFQIQSTDKDKGKFAFEFTGHYSMADQTKVPYEVYIQGGNAQPAPAVLLDKHAATLTVGDTLQLNAETIPDGESVTWSSSAGTKASVAAGLVTALQAGSTIITAKITVDEVDYTDTCTIVVEAAPSP